MTCITVLLSQLSRNIEQEFRAKQQYQPLLTDLFGGDYRSGCTRRHDVATSYDLYGITTNTVAMTQLDHGLSHREEP